MNSELCPLSEMMVPFPEWRLSDGQNYHLEA